MVVHGSGAPLVCLSRRIGDATALRLYTVDFVLSSERVPL